MDDFTTTTSVDSGALLITGVIGLAVGVFLIAAMWRMFSKAGRPGWAAIVPIYNIYVMCKIAGKSGWWVLWLCIPIVNIVTSIIFSIDLAKAFGKGALFGFFGLWMFGFIGYPILGFGPARHVGAGDRPAEPAAVPAQV
ncbi:MAG TPA: DUF5684 domain-containing protein [Actinophytocola sp.]|uniref:DUF5684 domain-containing protein n=1 Tax=Actinophytocola sp. TaxID=1872138 RepID=UPI002DB65140|nr:DUF5684 domain-containing protein [Actinophytocola sp.]HEU5470565.1 DUF5684 domain-containing protein [Actinophytocola sp.]